MAKAGLMEIEREQARERVPVVIRFLRWAIQRIGVGALLSMLLLLAALGVSGLNLVQIFFRGGPDYCHMLCCIKTHRVLLFFDLFASCMLADLLSFHLLIIATIVPLTRLWFNMLISCGSYLFCQSGVREKAASFYGDIRAKIILIIISTH